MPIGTAEVQEKAQLVSSKAIAPWPHTIFLLAILALWASYSALRSHLPPTLMPHSVSYTSSVIIQCLLAGTTIAGLYHRRIFISELMGVSQRINTNRTIGLGVATYIVGMIVVTTINLLLRMSPLHLTHRSSTVRTMAPQSTAELALWILVSLSAGICEEFVFRGYLQRQLIRWLHATPIATAVVSILFGCLHFYQGLAGVIEITALGTIYGIVAAKQGHLRTVMVAHFLQDVITGSALYFRSY